MSISKSINEENNISQKEHIYNFLTLEKCEDAGLIIEDFKDNILNLGAMNLGYIKVKKLIKELENKFEIEIKIKQIIRLILVRIIGVNPNIYVLKIRRIWVSDDPKNNIMSWFKELEEFLVWKISWKKNDILTT